MRIRHKRYLTDSEPRNRETFSLPKLGNGIYAPLPVGVPEAQKILIFKDNRQVFADDIRLSTREFDYTDPGTNNQLEVVYGVTD